MEIDNLTSHLSVDIIEACEQNDIRFIFLPPNSTHLTQPLDIAFFAPLKRLWRETLTTWKHNDGRHLTSIPKDTLPRHIKATMEKVIDGKGSQNFISGFQKAGIAPLDREKVLSQLPNVEENKANS